MEEGAIKRRKPWLAGLLSFMTGGLGQVYNGELKKGLLLYAVLTVMGLIVHVVSETFAGLVAGFTALFGFSLAVAIEAYATARKKQDYRLTKMNRWWVYALVLFMNFTVGTAVEVGFAKRFNKNFKVPSESMMPTLVVGDHFMAQMLDEDATIGRGEIVVFDDTKSGRHFVKRVIGLPGETIEIRNKDVFINGKSLHESHAHHTKRGIMPVRDNYGPYNLQADEYFMMGDNREESYDSRWIGPVKRNKIRGRARYIYFPGNIGEAHWFDRLGSAVR